MTVDVATLVFDFRSESAAQAEKAMDRLIAKGDQLDVTAKKVRRATDFVNEGHRGAAQSADGAARSATSLAQAHGAVEKAAKQAAAVQAKADKEATAAARQRTAEVKAARALEAASMREMVIASKAYDREQAAATKARAAGEKEASSAARAAAAEAKAARSLEAAAMRELVAATKAYERDQIAAARAIEAQVKASSAAKSAAEREAAASAKAASTEILAARRLEAAAQRELVAATKAYERDQKQAASVAAAAAREQAQAVQGLEARIFALKSAIDPTFAAQSRLDAEMKEATALYKMGAISASDYARAVGRIDDQVAAVARGQGVVAGAYGKSTDASRKLTLAGLDLSRQFADIGVTAAMGMNPLMIFIQQGPQIADRLAMMKMEGIGLTAVLRGMGAAAAPVAAALWPVALTVAVVAAGFALMHRELSKGYPKDITDGLGLTAEQLERVKTKTVSFGDTVQATFIVIGRHIMNGPIGDALKWLGKAFSDTLDWIVKTSVGSMANVVGVFVGAYEGVKAVWSLLPRAMSDIGIQTANFMINAVELMVNKSIAGMNKLIAVANSAASKVGLDMKIDPLATQDFGRIQNWDAGAAAKAGETWGKAASAGFEKGASGFRKGLGALGAEISAEALKLARKDALKEAGKANKPAAGAATPRDQTDERTAQIAGMLAQAMQDELQARLAITREARDRADLERQIAQAALMEKQAQVDKQIANIEQDVIGKRLTEAKAKELTDQLLIVQAMNGRTAAIRDTAITEAMNAQLAREAGERARSAIENQIDLLGAQADLTQSAYARALIEVDILKAQQQIERLKLEEVIASATSTATEKAIAQSRLNTLGAVQALELKLAQRQTRLVDAIGEAVDAVRGFKDAFRRHDWAQVFDELQRTIQTIQASFAANGLGGGLMTAGSAAASLIGGKGGRAVSGGLGIAGLGMGLGGMLTTGALPAVGALTGVLGVGGAGAIGGLMSTVGAALGPIGLAAGALYAAAKLFNVGGKPSNAGAGYDLRTGAMSGNKRTEETEGAARSAGEAIQGIMDAVKAAGIGLTDAVTGLVIGTRDQTQIYLASGQTLKSAVGDSGAAVDTAMRALLASATYVSDAQKKLVDSALAAGKGFDAVAEVLAKYEAAQGITGALADQILQLTDPKAYDVQSVKRDIEAQRKAYQQLATDGFITADLLATINGQLSTLEGLKLAEVLSRYGAAASAANDNADLIEKAKSDVLDAYETFASAKQAEIDALRQTEQGLKAFRRELDFGAIAGRSPVSQLAATRREFERLNAMDASNPERMANLQAVGTAFVEASRAASPTELAFQRDLAMVRRATEASGMAAGQQADIAQAQLNTATAQLTALGLLNTTTLDLATTLKTYLALTGQGGGAANDNVDFARYSAANPDLRANWDEGGIMRSLGGTFEAALRAQYASHGQDEIAKGLRTYAAGGSHPGGMRLVGEEGPELEVTGPSRIYSARDTARMMGGDNSELIAEVRALRAEVTLLRAPTERTASAAKSMDDRGRKQEVLGVYVRGETPGDPVITDEAA